MAKFESVEDLETLPVKIEYVGEVPSKWDSDTPRNVDQWRVTISGKSGFNCFDYFTGLGLRTQAAPMSKPPKVNTLAWVAWQKTRKPRKPKVPNVLQSLILDASAADENFHDWCANYGYSDDSIKSMNMYKACLETAQALRKHFSAETLRQVRELLQDY